MHHRFTAIVSAVSTALFTMVASGAVAYAQPQAETSAATCVGNSCSGKSPVATGCSSAGARVLADMVVLGVPGAKQYLVRHRYSSSCNASWTSVTAINQPDCLYDIEIWHEAIDNNTGKRTRTASVRDGDACSTYTVMQSKVGRSSRACAFSDWEGLTHCTRWA